MTDEETTTKGRGRGKGRGPGRPKGAGPSAKTTLKGIFAHYEIEPTNADAIEELPDDVTVQEFAQTLLNGLVLGAFK